MNHDQPTTEAPRVDVFSGLADLAVGWHYGQGGPIAAEEIESARLMHDALSALGAVDLEVFPAVDGSVLLAGSLAGKELDVLCCVGGSYDADLFSFDGPIVEAECVAFDEVVSRLSAVSGGDAG